MRIVVCPDSFKGSLTSVEAADAIERGLLRNSAFSDAEIVKAPLADGGEGTVDALVRATGGEIRHARALDPLLREIDSFFGLMFRGFGFIEPDRNAQARDPETSDGHTAVVEMAAASGLCLLSESERNALVTSTFGTGQLISAALDSGASKIIVGIGGSATNDGGAGAMAALGVRFFDSDGRELPPGGAALVNLDRIDVSGFRFPVGKIPVEVACDVVNPLTGPNGASAVYGPQKGATPEMVRILDSALENYARVIMRDLGKDILDLPGGGAAGGLGAGLVAFLKAQLHSGIEMILDAIGLDDIIANADLIITGEGRLDEQTAHGKTIAGILKRAKGVPVIAIAGSISGQIAGLAAAYSLTNETVTPEHAIAHAAKLLEFVTYKELAWPVS